MGITDYNKKKQLEITSASGTAAAFDVSKASFTQSFDVSDEDTLPSGLSFSDSGDKMFVCGRSDTSIDEYSLSTSFDVSTANFTDSFDVSGQESDINAVTFSDSGDKMFVAGNGTDSILEYSLSTNFDVSTASFTDSFSVQSQDTVPTGVAFSSSGDKMFVAGGSNENIYEYSLSTNFDVSTASFTDSFDTSAQDSSSQGVDFSDSGDKMFVAGGGTNSVLEYSLSTSFDVSTASFTDSFDVSAQNTSIFGVTFSNSGDKMFIAGDGSDKVVEYSIGSGGPSVDKAQPLIVRGEGDNFDVSTASFTDSFDVGSEDANPTAVSFNDSGDKMFVVGDTNDKVFEYSLSTAFDVSTASFTDSFDVSGQDTDPQGVAFSNTGDKMFVIGDINDNVYEYSLGTAFDVSTASFTDSFDVSGQDTLPRGVAFSDTGGKMYVVGNNNDNIFEYSLSTAFDVSTASFTDSFDVSGQDTAIQGVRFNGSGDKMFVIGAANDNVFEFSLTTAFDVSTASFTDSFDVSAQDTAPQDVAFSDTGDKMYVIGQGFDKVYEYSLGPSDSKTGNGDIVIDFSNVSGAEDIAVYDQNGNLLDYEVESLDTTNGTGVLWAYNDWVRDGTTQAQLAYGNNSANTDRQNATGTWNNTGQNAVMVQHLQDDPLTATDATSNNNDGSVNGATATSGQYDGAASFDGIDDFIDYGQTAAFGTTDGTLIVWANPDNVSESFPVFGTGLDHGYYLRTSASSGAANPSDVAQWLWKVDDGSTSEFFVSQLTDGVNTGEYYHLGMVLDNDSDLTGYVDGIESNSGDMSNIGDIDNGANLLQARVPGGNFGGDAPSPMDMDEFRVYSEVKNSDFMKADFDASPKAGQVFFSQQAAETTSTGVSATVTDSLGFSENTASTLSFTASDNLQVTESAAGTLSDTLSDNVQFSEQVLSTIQDDLTNQLGFTENTATALVSQVSDQLSFTEQTISNLTLQVLTSDNLQFNEQAEAQLLDTVTDQLSFQSTTQSAIAQSTSDQVTYSEAVSSALIDTLTDQIDFTEVTSVEGTTLLTLTDEVAFAENTESTLQDLESDQLGFNEDVESRLEQVLEDGLGFSEQFEAELADTLSDSLDFSDRVAETVAATLTDSLSFAEKITASELLDLEIRSPTKAVMTTPDRFAVMESITFKQNDLGDTLKATLKDDNGDINVSNASDVRLIANDRDGKNVLNESVTVTNGSAGEVEYSWSSGDFIEDAGIYRIEFEVEDGTGEVETVPNDGFVTVEIEEELAE